MIYKFIDTGVDPRRTRVTHLFNIAGHKHHVYTARPQLVEDQEGVNDVAETKNMSQSLACCHVSPICRSLIHRFTNRFNRGAAQSGVSDTHPAYGAHLWKILGPSSIAYEAVSG
jgi:hypothetical protein